MPHRYFRISDNERKLLMELAVKNMRPLLAPEDVVLSLMKKGLIGFGLTNRGDELTRDLKKHDPKKN